MIPYQSLILNIILDANVSIESTHINRAYLSDIERIPYDEVDKALNELERQGVLVADDYRSYATSSDTTPYSLISPSTCRIFYTGSETFEEGTATDILKMAVEAEDVGDGFLLSCEIEQKRYPLSQRELVRISSIEH